MTPTKVRAFVSYAHAERAHGGVAKRLLAEAGIDAFLAHEDVSVSDEWRDRILDELKQCSVFVAILSKAFLESKWCPQEVGFIASRMPDVIVVPLSLDDTVACGFIAHIQSRRITAAGITSELLLVPLAKRLPRVVLPGLIRIAGRAGDFRSAEAKMAPLLPLFPSFTPDEAEALAAAAVDNGQIWNAALCSREYLPELLRIHGENLKPKTRRALQYQIEHHAWYPGEAGSVDSGDT